MSRFIVSPAARDELERIWDYIGIENHSPQAAERLMQTMYEKFTLLGKHPLIGERCHEYQHIVPELRRIPVGNYIIYYTAMEDGVRIGHIAHGAMDQDALIRRWFLFGE